MLGEVFTTTGEGESQAEEQTFVWFSFKHILCGINKIHHLFYLYRMVRRRSKYTKKCYALGKKPVWPNAKPNHD